MYRIQLNVNGIAHTLHVDDQDLLMDVLRDQVGCTSVREGCGVGACGACTVLVSGKSISSCLALAVRYADAEITTADGLAEDDTVVRSFVDCGAMQCGYCIPGFTMMAKELISEQSRPDSEHIRHHLEGNLCRCGTYQEIEEAVSLASRRKADR